MSEYEPTNSTPEQPKVDSNPVNKSETDLSFEPFDTSKLQYIQDIDEKIDALKARRKEYLELVHFDSLGNARIEEDADGDPAIAMPGENNGQNSLNPEHEPSQDDLIAKMHANLEAQRLTVIQADEQINQNQSEQS